MVGDCFNLCIDAISAAFDWLNYILVQLDAWKYILGAFLIFTIFRLLLVPLVGGVIGGGSSDTVRSRNANMSDVKRMKRGRRNG